MNDKILNFVINNNGAVEFQNIVDEFSSSYSPNKIISFVQNSKFLIQSKRGFLKHVWCIQKEVLFKEMHNCTNVLHWAIRNNVISPHNFCAYVNSQKEVFVFNKGISRLKTKHNVYCKATLINLLKRSELHGISRIELLQEYGSAHSDLADLLKENVVWSDNSIVWHRDSFSDVLHVINLPFCALVLKAITFGNSTIKSIAVALNAKFIDVEFAIDKMVKSKVIEPADISNLFFVRSPHVIKILSRDCLNPLSRKTEQMKTKARTFPPTLKRKRTGRRDKKIHRAKQSRKCSKHPMRSMNFHSLQQHIE